MLKQRTKWSKLPIVIAQVLKGRWWHHVNLKARRNSSSSVYVNIQREYVLRRPSYPKLLKLSLGTSFVKRPVLAVIANLLFILILNRSRVKAIWAENEVHPAHSWLSEYRSRKKYCVNLIAIVFKTLGFANYSLHSLSYHCIGQEKGCSTLYSIIRACTWWTSSPQTFAIDFEELAYSVVPDRTWVIWKITCMSSLPCSHVFKYM